MKITVILPYFGKLPNYFQLWLKSAANNKMLSFLILTDNDVDVSSYSNISVKKMDFLEVQKRIHKKLGILCKIDTPYKLCDYKPTYGVIFSEFLKDSDWWGYCDPDVIWGDLDTFLKRELFESYEKILTLGHLTLFRNTPSVNRRYKNAIKGIPYTAFESFHMHRNVTFDENSNKFLSDAGIYKTYDAREAILDIWPHMFKFRTYYTQPDESYFIAEYDHGHVYGHIVIDGKIIRKEFMYIHLQKRKMAIKLADNDHFLIIPNQFIVYDKELITAYHIKLVNDVKGINCENEGKRSFNVNDSLVEFIRLCRKVLQNVF